jgi:hypothetical protein
MIGHLATLLVVKVAIIFALLFVGALVGVLGAILLLLRAFDQVWDD